MKPINKIINSNKKRILKSINNNIEIIFYIAAISTIGGGILHLLMLGPSSKPINFPMHLLPYTDTLFTISGILQIFWCIPMIKRCGMKWYYIGLAGAIGLSLLLLMTRIPNGITNLPLEDKNPMALLTEITQFLFIGVTIVIIKYEYRNGRFKSISNHIVNIKKDDMDISSDKNINIDLKKAESLNSKGVILRKLGKDDESIKCFEESLKINPAYVNAWYNMGVSLNKIGRKKDAIVLYNKAKQLCFK